MNTTKKILRAGQYPGLLLALAAFAGCGGPQKPKTESATTGGGTTSADDPMAVLEKPAAPVRAVSEDERADFGKAVTRYLDLSKKGRLDASACGKAADAFAAAAKENPKLTEARYDQGRILFECGNEDEALRIFQDLAKGPNPYAPALTNLGLAAWRRKDLAEAEKMFVRAIEIDPNINSAAARNNLAQILRDRMMVAGGEERKRLAAVVIRHLRTVLAVDGNNLQAYATLCHVYHELDLDEMARLVGDQAIGRANEIATGHFVEEKEATVTEVQVGGGATTGKKGKKGKDTKADAADGGKKTVHEVEGTGYTREMNQQLALVYNTLGLIDLRKKSVTSAIANFGRAIEKDPDLFEARMNRAALTLNFRNYATAEEDFRAVLKAQPRNFEAVTGLGVALRGGKKIEEAEKEYLVAVQLDPANPRSYFNLGLLYQDYKGSQKPELQKAQQYYRDFISKAGNGDPMKKEAQKRIKDIDEMFTALIEAEKMQREAEEMQRKADEQQKQMQEELKKQLLLEQQQQGTAPAEAPGAAPPPAAPPTTQPPAAGK